jgi:drug/metabolite transporter (DMT)-like permease
MTQGYVFAFLATLSWAISIFPLTRASRKIPVNSMNHFRLVFSTLLVLMACLIFESQNFISIFSADYLQAWIWLGLSGLVALVLGDFFSFRMYAILSPRFGSVLTTLSPTAALLLGIILVNERMNWVGITGMLITIIGVMSISLGRTERNAIPDHGHGSVAKGIVFGILAALCHGAGLALSKKGFVVQGNTGASVLPLSATFIRLLTGMLIVIMVTILRGRIRIVFDDLGKYKPSVLPAVALGSLFSPVLAVSLSMFSILYIKVAVAQTLFALVPLFALMISHFVYKEKITIQAVVGMAVALIGVVLLIWRESIGNLF